MALHQPTRQAAPRILRPAIEDEDSRSPLLTATRPVEEPQTWVLFPPATDAATTTSYLTSTQRTNTTQGHSRFGDLGSLNTLAPSELGHGHQYSNSFVDATDDDDDAELDSLDGHLPEFRSAHDSYLSSEALPTFLPAHDGLGMFPLEQEGMGPDVQNRLYAFERYNPNRIRRRRESFDAARAELEREENQEVEKMRRIESWRLEQSRYLLEEIQKETRRQRPSASITSSIQNADKRAEEAVTSSEAENDMEEEWHDQSADESSDDRDSIWSRITRKVIQDLLGIDDKMLAILVGEALPDEEELSTTPKQSNLPPQRRDENISPDTASESTSWQAKMLERVARELGLLVHHLSEHPDGFTTFGRMQQMQQMPIPYAGLPAIPESSSSSTPVSDPLAFEESGNLPEFQPTMPTPIRPTNGLQTRAQPSTVSNKPQAQTDKGSNFTQEEWEQDLDIRLVFRYLRSRFLPLTGGSAVPSSATHLTSPSVSAQDAAAKVARVRQHHPLISRSRNVEKRKSKATSASNAAFRPVSSYASQSTRRSVRRSSCSSSRHYWDIGGSVGTGSIIATTGPMGTWGEI